MAPATRLSPDVESDNPDSVELCMMFYLVFNIKPEHLQDLDFINIDDNLIYHYRVIWNNYQIFLNVKYGALDCRIDSWNVKDSSGNSPSSPSSAIQEVQNYFMECGLHLTP